MEQCRGLRGIDMTPLEFYLWYHLKSLIYETPVESEMDLAGKRAVAVWEIAENPRVIKHVLQSMKRYQSCIDVGSGHFEQLF